MLKFLIFSLVLINFHGLLYACNEPFYCKNNNFLYFTAEKEIIAIDFNKPLTMKKILMPDSIQQKTDGKICVLECNEDKVVLLASSFAFEFQPDDVKGLKLLKEFPRPKSIKETNSLLHGPGKGKEELFKNDKYSISFSKSEIENQKTATSIMHLHTNKLIKTSIESGKIIEELIVLKEERLETID